MMLSEVQKKQNRRLKLHSMNLSVLILAWVIVLSLCCTRVSTPLILRMIVCLNTVVRLSFPSCYCPAKQDGDHFVQGPMFARLLATAAEIVFYRAEAHCTGLSFVDGPVGMLTILGECVCWLHVLLQSEMLGWTEDVIWTILQVYVLFFGTKNKRLRLFICIPFILYMSFVHLPRMYKRIRAPYYKLYTRTIYNDEPDDDTIAWTVPSLLLQPLVYLLFLHCMPKTGIIP